VRAGVASSMRVNHMPRFHDEATDRLPPDRLAVLPLDRKALAYEFGRNCGVAPVCTFDSQGDRIYGFETLQNWVCSHVAWLLAHGELHQNGKYARRLSRFVLENDMVTPRNLRMIVPPV